jgi:hypothetical protein
VGYPRDLISGYPSNVLLLDEPWPTEPTVPECDAALTSWYGSLRDGWPLVRQDRVDAALERILSACGVLSGEGQWEFTPKTYHTLLDGIADREALKLSRFDGFSFASARWGYASDLFTRGRLASPFPISMGAERYLTMRSNSHGPRPHRSLIGIIPKGRSLSLTQLDLDAAALETRYLPPSARPAALTGRDAASMVAQLSDQLFGRYGVESISHALLS